MKKGTKQSSRHVHAVLAALDILECFEKEPFLSLKQLIDISGLTRNRVMRLSGTLEERGFLSRNIDTEKFTLGPKILVLGKILERNFDLVLLARPLLKQLAEKTGESSSLYAIDGFDRLVLAREESAHDIRYSVVEGQRLPLYAGAAGKVLLAFGPEEVKRKVLRQKSLDRLTPQTIVNRKVLEAELSKIRSRGYAFSHAERVPDAGSIAVPVFDHENLLVCAMGIAGPDSRVNSQTLSDFLTYVVETAETLSKLLGAT